MKIFIICCLLFIHVNMCMFIRGFRVSVRVSGIRGFGFGDGFPPESVFSLGSGFDFGFQFWVHRDSTRSEPDPLPFLPQASEIIRLGALPAQVAFPNRPLTIHVISLVLFLTYHDLISYFLLPWL
jgi:hypothetical protein